MRRLYRFSHTLNGIILILNSLVAYLSINPLSRGVPLIKSGAGCVIREPRADTWVRPYIDRSVKSQVIPAECLNRSPLLDNPVHHILGESQRGGHPRRDRIENMGRAGPELHQHVIDHFAAPVHQLRPDSRAVRGNIL